MRTFKKLLPFLVGLIAFLCINSLLNFLFVPYQFTRVKIHKIETESFDDLILGSSHGSSAMDPDVISGHTGRSCFNAAAGGQFPCDNYYLLLDAMREHAPGRVILEYDPSYFVVRDGFNRNARYQLHEMAMSGVKARYFLDQFFPGDIRYVLMPWSLYSLEKSAMENNIRRKTSDIYRSYSVEPFIDSAQACGENGFVAIADESSGERSTPELFFSESNSRAVEENRKYFEKILQFLSESGIEAVVVMTPVPDSTRDKNEAFYLKAHEMMTGLAGRYGAKYLDFVVPDEGDSFRGMSWDDELFSDGEGHMRVSTARSFSGLLGSLI